MSYTVTVTNQGQISIPAVLRKKYHLDKNRTIVLHDMEEKGIQIQPVGDLLDIGGTFRVKQKVSPRKIRKAFSDYMAKRHLQRKDFPFPHVSS